MAKSKKRHLLKRFIALGLCAQLFLFFDAFANTAKDKPLQTNIKKISSKDANSCTEIFLQEFRAQDASLGEFVERLESAIKRRGLILVDQLREMTLCSPEKIPKAESDEALFYTRALYFYRAGVRFLSDSRSSRQGMSEALRKPQKVFLYQGEASKEVYADLNLTAPNIASFPKMQKSILDKKLTKIKTSEAMKSLLENEADFYDLISHWNTEKLVLDLFFLLKNKRKNICVVTTLQEKCIRDPIKKGVELYDGSGKKCSNLVTRSTCPHIKSEQQVLLKEAEIYFLSYFAVTTTKRNAGKSLSQETKKFIEQLFSSTQQSLSKAQHNRNFFIEWQQFHDLSLIK